MLRSQHIQVINQVCPCSRTAQIPAQVPGDTRGVHDQLREKREEQSTNKTWFAQFYATWLIYSLLAASNKISLVKHLTVHTGNDYKANSSGAKSTQRSSRKIKNKKKPNKCSPLPGGKQDFERNRWIT